MTSATLRRTVALLCLFAVAALAVRLLPVAQVVRPDGVRFYDSDSFYHLRRIDFCIEHFPRIPIHDPYSNYPHGGVTMWPPLNDAAMAGIAMAIGGPNPARETVERVAAFFPSVVGALTIFPMFALGLLLAGRRQGLLAAGLLAMQPAHVLYSAVGRPDQHVTEIFGSVTLFACLLALPSLSSTPASDHRRARSVIPVLLGALAGAGTILVWMGALLFHGVVVGFAGLIALNRLRHDTPLPAPFAREVMALVTAEAVLLSLASGYLLHGMQTESTYVSFSWFQAHFLVVATVALALLLGTVVWFRQGRGEALRSVGPSLTVLMLLTALLLPTGLSGTVTTTLRGLKHVTKTSELIQAEDGSHHVLSYNKLWLRNIQEYRPLLFPRDGFDAQRWAMPYVGPVLFLAPVLALFHLGRRNGPPRERRVLLPVWTMAAALMALAQVKYVYLLAPLAAFYVADLLVALSRLRPPPLRIAIVCATATGLLLPGAFYLADFNRRYVDLPEHMREALLALERITPEPGDYTDPEAVPDYGVFAFWDLGNYMQYLSQRPVVANNNGYGFEDTIEFYFARTPAQANAVLQRRGVRYLVLTNRIPSLATIWNEMHDTLDPYFRADAMRRLEILEPYDSLVYTRLYFADGQPLLESDSALEDYRLIYEQPGPATRLRAGAPLVAPIKIFEVVPGNRIVGSGYPPGQSATLETRIVTNLGREFIDRRSTLVNADGTFEIRNAYGTSEILPVRPIEAKVVFSDGTVQAIPVPEDVDVLEGRTYPMMPEA